MLTKLIQAFRPRPQMRLQVMAEDEMVARFGEIPASRLWPALMAELDEFIIRVSDDVVDEENPNKLFKAAGGQAYLMDFKLKLLQRERVARGLAKTAADAKEEEEEAGAAGSGA
jgi:hypothetical protein